MNIRLLRLQHLAIHGMQQHVNTPQLLCQRLPTLCLQQWHKPYLAVAVSTLYSLVDPTRRLVPVLVHAHPFPLFYYCKQLCHNFLHMSRKQRLMLQWKLVRELIVVSPAAAYTIPGWFVVRLYAVVPRVFQHVKTCYTLL